MITVWWWKLVLVNSNSNSMLLFWNGRWCWVISWGYYFRPDHVNFAIFMCCCWNMLSCESMGHAGLARIKHHLVLVVDGSWGWARLLAVNQTQKSNNLAQMLHANQTRTLVHRRPGRGWPGPSSLARPCTALISNTPFVPRLMGGILESSADFNSSRDAFACRYWRV